MSRHTLNDGVTEDPRLTGAFDEWIPELGPSPRLIGSYYRGELGWDEFAEAYLHSLTTDQDRLRALQGVVARSLTGETLTLLCVECEARDCHRSLLARVLSQRFGVDVLVR